MRKQLVALTAAVVLLVSSAFAITDYGSPTVSRLWQPTTQGDRFVCTVSYIFPFVNEYVGWVVTAGHCITGGANYLRRSHENTVISLVNWRAMLLGDLRYTLETVDLAIGTAPDMRDGTKSRFWLADKFPTSGDVYIHGFPNGVERVTAAHVVPFASEKMKGSALVVVRTGEIAGGSSGSPVLNAQGQLVGILWGKVPEQYVPLLELPRALAPGHEIAAVTPVEKLHELFRTLRVKS